MTYKIQDLISTKDRGRDIIKVIIVNVFLGSMALMMFVIAIVAPFLDLPIWQRIGICLGALIVVYILALIRKFLFWIKVNPDADKVLLKIGLKAAVKIWAK